MPRKASLARHHSSKELKQKYLRSQNSVESRRWHLLWKISLGWSIKNSALAIGINYDYAKQEKKELRIKKIKSENNREEEKLY